jgi:hypothetical protein
MSSWEDFLNRIATAGSYGAPPNMISAQVNQGMPLEKALENTKDFYRSVGQGLTIESNDEIEALVRTIFGDNTYGENVGQIRSEMDKFHEENPEASWIGYGSGIVPTLAVGAPSLVAKIGAKPTGALLGMFEGGMGGRGTAPTSESFPGGDPLNPEFWASKPGGMIGGAVIGYLAIPAFEKIMDLTSYTGKKAGDVFNFLRSLKKKTDVGVDAAKRGTLKGIAAAPFAVGAFSELPIGNITQKITKKVPRLFPKAFMKNLKEMKEKVDFKTVLGLDSKLRSYEIPGEQLPFDPKNPLGIRQRFKEIKWDPNKIKSGEYIMDNIGYWTQSMEILEDDVFSAIVKNKKDLKELLNKKIPETPELGTELTEMDLINKNLIEGSPDYVARWKYLKEKIDAGDWDSIDYETIFQRLKSGDDWEMKNHYYDISESPVRDAMYYYDNKAKSQKYFGKDAAEMSPEEVDIIRNKISSDQMNIQKRIDDILRPYYKFGDVQDMSGNIVGKSKHISRGTSEYRNAVNSLPPNLKDEYYELVKLSSQKQDEYSTLFSARRIESERSFGDYMEQFEKYRKENNFSHEDMFELTRRELNQFYEQSPSSQLLEEDLIEIMDR